MNELRAFINKKDNKHKFVQHLLNYMWQIPEFRDHYIYGAFRGQTMVDFWRDIAWPNEGFDAAKVEKMMRGDLKNDSKLIADFDTFEDRPMGSDEWKPPSVMNVIKDRYVSFKIILKSIGVTK